MCVTVNAETLPQKMEVDPCQVQWWALPEPTEQETDYSSGLHSNLFDLNGDGIIDLSVIFQITYTSQDELVYDLNHAPLFIRVGTLMGVFDEIQESVHCRIYGGHASGGLLPGE